MSIIVFDSLLNLTTLLLNSYSIEIKSKYDYYNEQLFNKKIILKQIKKQDTYIYYDIIPLILKLGYNRSEINL